MMKVVLAQPALVVTWSASSLLERLAYVALDPLNSTLMHLRWPGIHRVGDSVDAGERQGAAALNKVLPEDVLAGGRLEEPSFREESLGAVSFVAQVGEGRTQRCLCIEGRFRVRVAAIRHVVRGDHGRLARPPCEPGHTHEKMCISLGRAHWHTFFRNSGHRSMLEASLS